jgi:hypothetical protein
MLTIMVATPSRRPCTASEIPHEAINGNAMILTGVLKATVPLKSNPWHHHRRQFVQPVHQYERAERYHRMAQPASRGESQRGERQHGMYAMTIAPPSPAPRMADMSPNSNGACESHRASRPTPRRSTADKVQATAAGESGRLRALRLWWSSIGSLCGRNRKSRICLETARMVQSVAYPKGSCAAVAGGQAKPSFWSKNA